MLIAMGITAFLCIFIGVVPGPLYALLPYAIDYAPYTTTHVITQLQLLMFSALAFTVLMKTGVYPPELRSVNLDSDWTYRKLLPSAINRFMALGQYCHPQILARGERKLERFIAVLYRHHGPEGKLAQTWPTGSMVLWVAVLLGCCLIFYYI